MATLTKKAAKEAEKAEAKADLLKLLKPGDTVHCVLRNVSASGMSRRIDFYIVRDGDLRFISGYIGRACDYKHSDKGGLVVSGCGMDMGFHVVYELGRTLFPQGFKVEGHGRNGDTSGWDSDGGYALRHSWV